MKTLNLSDRVYDLIRKATTLYLPAFATAYAGLALIWPIPEPERVAQTVVVVCTLLAAILRGAEKGYEPPSQAILTKTGSDEDGDDFTLELTEELPDLFARGTFTVKVEKDA